MIDIVFPLFREGAIFILFLVAILFMGFKGRS